MKFYVDIDINAPKIGGRIDIYGLNKGVPTVHGPIIDGGIDIHEPPKEIPTIRIKNPNINASLNKGDSGQSMLPSLNTIIDSQAPDVQFTSNIDLQETSLPDPKSSASLSVKVEATQPSISLADASAGGSALLNNLISSDDKKKGTGKLKSTKNALKSGKPQPKMSKPDIHVGIHAKVEDPKVRVSVSGASGKSKPKPRQSGKDLSHAKVKEVQLPGKIIKMKDLISLPYKDPIHDVKEIPRFEIYKSKK